MALILPIAGSDDDAENALRGSRLRCTANGQPVQLPEGDQATDTRGARILSHGQAVPTPQGGSTSAEIRFGQVVFGVPLAFGPDAAADRTSVSRTPGRWQCDLRNNGQTVRTFAFTVAPDGTFQPHAEQAAGLYLGPRAILVDVTIPATGARAERTAPDEVRAGGFHGRAWATDAMRAAAQAVPAIGAPPHLAAPARAAAPRGGGGGAARRRR
jgi:hypothetical protein